MTQTPFLGGCAVGSTVGFCLASSSWLSFGFGAACVVLGWLTVRSAEAEHG